MKKLIYSLLSGLAVVSISMTCPVMADTVPNSNGTPLEWGQYDGTMNVRRISPAGDILDSSNDVLALMQMAPINLPGAGLTPEAFKNPQSAETVITNALFAPKSAAERAKMTSEENVRLDAYQRYFTDQAVSFSLTLGLKAEQNVDHFVKRRDQALKFINTAENYREDIQVLNGVTLGQLSETNKMLGLTTTLAILMVAKDMDIPVSSYGTSQQ